MKTQTFEFAFAADGKPASLKWLAGQKQLLNLLNPGNGFYLRNIVDRPIPLTHVTRLGDGRLCAASENKSQEVIFGVRECGKYIAFRIERTKGIPLASSFTLHFQMNADPSVRAMELDYMTNVRNEKSGVTVNWPYLWKRNSPNPIGGFALYASDGPDDEDDTILRIWVDENLPHPKVESKWDLAAARAFAADWQERYADQSLFYLEAKTLDELYEGAKYAEKAGVRAVYLFTNTWREGGEFWPDTGLNWEIRKSVFPNGEKDLRAYADFLESKGMHLMMHWVSGGFGFHDPKYVTPKPDRRLASLGAGQLVEAIGDDDSTLIFKPKPGVELPYHMCNPARGITLEHVPALEWIHAFNYFRINDELIKVGSFEDTDRDVWHLRDCERGLFGTKAARHASGDEAVGLIAPYNVDFVPDNDSDLLDEVAEEYAGMINRCRVSDNEYDGFEIHGFDGFWGSEKFASKVYAALDHPTIAATSSARPPYCYIEFKLNSTQRLMRGKNWATHGGYSAAVILESQSRVASTLLDTHFSMSKAAANKAPSFSLTRPEPMFGLTIDTLRTHGLTEKFVETVRNWKSASQNMTEEQRAKLLSSYVEAFHPFPDSSRDPASEIVWQLRKGEKQYEIIPVTVLRREKGDILYHSWQEHGPISPRQYVKAGEKLELINPNNPQAPRFIIHCLYAFDPARPTTTEVVNEPLKDAKWIWGNAKAQAKGALFQALYEIPEKEQIAHARFHFCVTGRLALWINGQRVDEGGESGQVITWDVTPYVHPGQNTIAIAAEGEGQSRGFAAKIEAQLAVDLKAQIAAAQAAAFEGKTPRAPIVSLVTSREWKSAETVDGKASLPDFEKAQWKVAQEIAAMGDAPFGMPKDPDCGNIPIQPKSSEITDLGDTVATDDDGSLTLSIDNPRNEALLLQDALPLYPKNADMRRHRGIGLTVTGDGSGAMVVFAIPGREYLVSLDFKGTRYIEIPNGEASWADGRWGWRMNTHRADYANVGRMHLGFGLVQPQTHPTVKIQNMVALKEIETELKDPVVRIGLGVLELAGMVLSSEYLVFEGGATATAYDRNWNKMRDLTVKAHDFVMPKGKAEVSIASSAGNAAIPWLDVQFMTEGEGMVVPL